MLRLLEEDCYVSPACYLCGEDSFAYYSCSNEYYCEDCTLTHLSEPLTTEEDFAHANFHAAI
jgi:hypothetical protein